MKAKTTIIDAIVKIKEMELPETQILCWLFDEENGIDFEGDYCYDCAEKEIEQSNKDVIISSSVSHDADGCRLCDTCGVILDVVLTEGGVLSELEHFECSGITTSSDWRHFLDVLESIRYVESKDFPYSFMREKEIVRARELHKRALELYVKWEAIKC